MSAAVLVNGVSPVDPLHALSVEDRGFHYGDGLFESALLANGRVRFLEQHLRRLALGCERLGIEAPSAALLRSDVQRLSGSAQRGVFKIVVSRGTGPRSYRPSARSRPTRVVALYPPPPQPASEELALRWCATRLGRNARLAGIKHLNRLEQVLAQAEWHDEAVVDGLMLDTEGELISGTANNVFVVRDGALLTPDLRFCGVHGIMRAEVLLTARALGIAVHEEPLWPADVERASEIFLTNAVRGIRSISSLGSLRWSAAAVADRLRQALQL
ncbi:MAG TPA: aminodeoxychorismate lyase [Steroidobacteraceae bacterium]|nr:aminodeoxychorismate lyase [Steroidobacteraceae bacterium]